MRCACAICVENKQFLKKKNINYGKRHAIAHPQNNQPAIYAALGTQIRRDIFDQVDPTKKSTYVLVWCEENIKKDGRLK